MFRGLRLRLTLLYLGVALALLGFGSGGTYQLVDGYLQSIVDLGLQHKMAQELAGRGATVPSELADATRTWQAERPPLAAPSRPTPTEGAARPPSDDEGEEEHASASGTPGKHDNDDDRYDADLAAIFVLPLDAQGQAVGSPATTLPQFAPNAPAASTALTVGHDWRTVTLGPDVRVRLLTYRVEGGTGPAVLQLGRVLVDQDRVLHQLLLILLGLGGVSTVLLGAGSWVLAGRALRPAQESWDRQQLFVANASHELRTPLTLLRASAEVARRSLAPDDADRRELLDDVLTETDHMSRLVEDLLLLSRIDAGGLVLERAPVPLAPLLDEVQRQMARLAGERGVHVEVPEAQGTALGDRTRLRQVLLILMDNALRHTPAGGSIRLTATRRDHHVQIGVADTGSGIAPEHLPRIFERFYQAAPAHRGTGGGAGLGLAIARGLVEAQHGQIALESRPGAGTQVRITLPGGA